MHAWYDIEAVNAAKLLELAEAVILAHEGFADEGAVLSHFGYRSRDVADWEHVESQFLPLGDRYVTQDRGRDFIFVKLREPLTVGKHVLEYVEFPEPKTPAVVEPSLVLFFKHDTREKEPQTIGQCVVRQGLLGATDHLKRCNQI